MSNDVDTQVIQNTQKALAKYIKKPPLTEKLLKKPPFRFLHDVITNVIRETGFLKGLYTERELISENVKDKEEKIAFLNKLIEATKAITGTELAVRSTKVIAGLEPAETNLLLQAIGTALHEKLDSTQYVAQVKSENKGRIHASAQESDKKGKREKNKEKYSSKTSKSLEKTTIATAPTSKSQQKQNVAVVKAADKVKPVKSLASKNSTDSVLKNDITKSNNKIKKTKEKNSTPHQEAINAAQSKKSEKTVKENENTEPEFSTELVVTETEEIKVKEKVTEFNAKQDEEEVVKTEDLVSQKLIIHTEQTQKGDEIGGKQTGELRLHDTEEVTVQPSSTGLPAERAESAKPRTANLRIAKDANNLASSTNKADESPEEKNNTDHLSTVRPRSSLRPPSVRPSSARPGAPRLKADITLPEGEVIPLGKVKVIVESYNNKDVDEEETVTIQTAPEPELHLPVLQLPTDKGHLVEQILEQIHQDNAVEHVKSTINIEWEQDGLRSRNIANKEIEQLKTAIQTLTRTANPLGKLVNYLHEDIEAMHSELDMWINSARQIMVEVTSQKRINDESNKPLQVQLEEIEDSISKYQQQIVTAHGNILHNETRIKDLLVK